MMLTKLTLSFDASQTRLGWFDIWNYVTVIKQSLSKNNVLLQNVSHLGHASIPLTSYEQDYAQIEKQQ